MANNENKHKILDINECTSRGVCTISPTIAALEQVAMTFVQQIAHYILELSEFGANNKKIRYQTLSSLASLIAINEFSENQLHSIIINEYFILEEVKNTYNKLCKEQGIQANNITLPFEFNQFTSVAKTIKFGENILTRNREKQTSTTKNLTKILETILKSLCQNIMNIKDFDIFDEMSYKEVLKVLDTFNHKTLSEEELKRKIDLLAILDNKIQLQISNQLLEGFDGINEVEVNHSTTPGKAILVSGNNLFDLYNLLEETKDKNIDIYTHSNLLITHALNKFQQFKNLKGHYGNSTENCILDFATFPGAILLTKNSQNNTEYLYRGRLFTNDYIVPDGVIKIEDNNFDELIETAVNSRGFKSGREKLTTKIGYNIDKINEKFDEVINNLNSDKIKRLYIIGFDSHTESQKEYLNNLFNNIKQDEYVISFSQCQKNKDNILTINVGNYIPLASNLLQKFFKNYPITSEKIVYFITTCDIMTISSIVMLKVKHAKNLYMIKCPPTLMNPAVYETYKQTYKINNTTTAKQDLESIRNSN